MIPSRQRQYERAILLCLLGGLVFNFPLLSLWVSPSLVSGIPTTVLFLFIAWMVYIFLIRLLTRWSRGTGTEEQRGD